MVARTDEQRKRKREYDKQWREANKEKVDEYAKQYYQVNKKTMLGRQKRHYQVNRKIVLASQKQYREANKEAEQARRKRYYQANKEAVLESHRKYSQANSKPRRQSSLRKNYGITLADYDAMFEAQAGCCAICGRHQSEFKRRLAVDHNHDTGRVRALLCDSCNYGLGFFRESQDLLSQAIDYLNAHNPRTD